MIRKRIHKKIRRDNRFSLIDLMKLTLVFGLLTTATRSSGMSANETMIGMAVIAATVGLIVMSIEVVSRRNAS